MTPEEIKRLIKLEEPFTDGQTFRAKVPLAGETGIGLGELEGPARKLFAAELEFSTLRYVVLSGTNPSTPILWRGAWQWTMPPRRWMKSVNHDHYLLMLETIWEIENDAESS